MLPKFDKKKQSCYCILIGLADFSLILFSRIRCLHLIIDHALKPDSDKSVLLASVLAIPPTYAARNIKMMTR